MTLQYVAIDDEKLALQLLKQHASETAELSLVKTFEDALEGLSFLQNNKVDLLFIDINMPDISGIELIQSLREKPLVIFTTAHKKFAAEGFELDAVDYLLKPISAERFKKAVSKAIDFYKYEKRKSISSSYLFVRSEHRIIKIDFDEIEFIESLEDYIKIHLEEKKSVLSLMTLKNILEKIPADKFMRIHRGYVVSLRHIKSFSNKKILLSSSRQLPVSDSYFAALNSWLRQNLA